MPPGQRRAAVPGDRDAELNTSMTPRPLADGTATGRLTLFRSGQASPMEAMQAVLARIERVQPKLDAFCLVASEDALARETRRAARRPRWPPAAVRWRSAPTATAAPAASASRLRPAAALASSRVSAACRLSALALPHRRAPRPAHDERARREHPAAERLREFGAQVGAVDPDIEVPLQTNLLPAAQARPFGVTLDGPKPFGGRAMDTDHLWMEAALNATFARLPAISEPAGLDAVGALPMALQPIGRPLGDDAGWPRLRGADRRVAHAASARAGVSACDRRPRDLQTDRPLSCAQTLRPVSVRRSDPPCHSSQCNAT